MSADEDFVVTILIITAALGGIIFVLSLLVLYFMHIRVLRTLSLMSDVASKGATRFGTLKLLDKTVERLAATIGGSMSAMNDDRANFARLTFGERSRSEHPAGTPASDPGGFKTPQNVFDEVSFNDPQYQTIRADVLMDDVFVKKDGKVEGGMTQPMKT